MKEYLLKGKSFWQVRVSQVCLWSLRKILKLPEIARNFIQFKVGDGSSIFGLIRGIQKESCMNNLAIELYMMLVVRLMINYQVSKR